MHFCQMHDDEYLISMLLGAPGNKTWEIQITLNITARLHYWWAAISNTIQIIIQITLNFTGHSPYWWAVILKEHHL